MKEKVYWWIDENEGEAVRLLQELIRTPSVNPYFDEDKQYMQEGKAQAYLEEYLEDMGMDTELTHPDAGKLAAYKDKADYYADHTPEDRPNLLGTLRGEGGGRSILLSGHMDVVQRGNKWVHDSFGAEIVDGKVYGRGVLDMEGGIAAMTVALKAISRSGIELKGDTMIGTVVDEEAGGMGTLALVVKGYRVDGCSITEPTHLKIAPLCRGILWGKLIIEGRSGRIELRQGDYRTGRVVNTIDKASLYLEHFRRLNKEWSVTKEHKYLPIPYRLHVVQFNAGEYPTIFANHAELIFDVQYLLTEKDENGLGSRVKEELEDFVQAAVMTDPWLRESPSRIGWLIDASCEEMLNDQLFFQTIRDSAREINPGSGVEGICCHTDMGRLCNVSIPTTNTGPGDSRLAHQADEYVEVDELVTYIRMIASILIDWCGVA